MPIRIYALAKELKVDSKDLVDICAKAGVTGKGSALASLTDSEVEKVKTYLGGSSKGGQKGRSRAKQDNEIPDNYTRDDYIGPSTDGSKIRVISTKPQPVSEQQPSSEKPTEQPVAETADAEVEAVTPEASDVTEVTETPEAAQTTEAVEEAETVAPETPVEETPQEEPSAGKGRLSDAPVRPSPPPLTRPPMRDEPSIKDISQVTAKGKKDTPKQESPRRGAAPQGPVIHLAAIPKAKQPKAKPKANEPAPQKPILSLPTAAIRGVKEGQNAPLKEFTQHHEKKRKPDAKEATKETTPSRGKGKGKGKGGRGEPTLAEGDSSMAGMANTRKSRQEQRKRRSPAKEGADETTPTTLPRSGYTRPGMSRPGRFQRRGTRLRRKGTNTAAPRKSKVSVELPCTLRDFSEATGTSSAELQRVLMAGGIMATVNAQVDFEMAELLSVELELDLELKEQASLEERVLTKIEDMEDAPETLEPRPPVITFLGHVDHGKTSLLDKVIGLDVVSGEAGGITQHIRAYTVKKDGKAVSFVDTPGHEAFTEMRLRGANVTDIAVLVIAADDGIMPQTEEAISHAKAAGVSIVVALNKIDLPGIDTDEAKQRVFAQLSQHELIPSEWGGEVEVVPTSAITGEGLDTLLETLLLVAEVHEYKANPNRVATGVCLEAEQESGRGVMAKFIVQKGTLKVGDIVVCGGSYGRVKAMYDTLKTKTRVKAAGPSVPVNLSGLNVAPAAGESFYVLDDISKAREIAELRTVETRQQSLSGRSTRISFEDFQQQLAEGQLGGSAEDTVVLNLILRADVRGSIEAVIKELGKIKHPEVEVKILQATVGGVTVGDVMLAEASNAVIVGFNVIPDEAARIAADEKGVEIRRYSVIYKITDDVRAILEGRLKPEEKVAELGRALVQQVFAISRLGTIAGCRVLTGTIERGCRVRVNRDNRGIGDYALDSLRREKDDAKSVREGYECGIKLAGFNDLKQGDILEAYRLEEVARTLE